VNARPSLDLASIDGEMLDGLDFCREVYRVFDGVRRTREGKSDLRMMRTQSHKRLSEELLPIARYILARYQEGRRIAVQWEGGSQPYDAKLINSGPLIENGLGTREMFLEVTTVVHPNEHLVRELVDSGGVAFGPDRTGRDRRTKKVVSEAHARDCDDLTTDLAKRIVKGLKSKAKKGYPDNTVLVVNCIPITLIFDTEWEAAVHLVKSHAYMCRFLKSFSLSATGLRHYGGPGKHVRRAVVRRRDDPSAARANMRRATR
jgi:hypothetical protein